MKNYKKGDLVRCTCDTYNELTKGEVYTVMKVSDTIGYLSDYAFITGDAESTFNLLDRWGNTLQGFEIIPEDLTKLDKPYKDLDLETQKRIICAYLDDEEIEWKGVEGLCWGWHRLREFSVLRFIHFIGDVVYRVKTKKDNSEQLQKIEELEKQLKELKQMVEE